MSARPSPITSRPRTPPFASPTYFPQTSFRTSFRSLLCRSFTGDPVTNDVDVIALLNLFFRPIRGPVGIGDAAQRQRYGAGLARTRERLGLLGLQLERGRPADESVDALLFLWCLVDRQHPDIGENDFRRDDIGQFLVPIFLALGQDHVDAVVRQDESASAVFRRDLGRDSPHAGRQDRRHEAGAVGLDQLLFADRFTRDEGRARDRAGDFRDGVGLAAAVDEVAADGRRRPGLPLHIIGLDRLAERDVGFCDQNFYRRQLRDRFGRAWFFVRPTGEIGGNTAGAQCDGQDDDTCDVHTLYNLLLRRGAPVHGNDGLPLGQ